MDAVTLKNVSFTYWGKKETGIKDLSLGIKRGEFILLTGKSGCGKTTLTRLINGLIPHFYPGRLLGSVLVNGSEVQKTATYQLAELVGSVFQDPRSQFFTTNTLSEVAFGCENLKLHSDEINRRVTESFSAFRIENLKNRSIFSLSSGEKQKVALAATYASHPRIYVLDEPSSNLDVPSTKMLARLLKFLKDLGNTIIVSEHRLYYLTDLADRIIYLENGKLIQEWTPDEAARLTQPQLKEMGLRSLSPDGMDYLNTMQPSRLFTSPAALSSFLAKDISINFQGHSLFHKAGFSVLSPETQGIIGITGANGIGKTTLVKYICGLLKRQKGRIEIDGLRLAPGKRIRKTYFVMQDTDYQLFTESVEDELRLGNRKEPDMDKKIEACLCMLGLSRYRDTHPMALSGGQKQRVTIAAAAVSPAKILFFDEPTSGLDGESMGNVSNILKLLYQNGKLIFVISHDLEFLCKTCGRIIYLKNGRVAEDFPLTPQTGNKLKTLLFTEEAFKI